MTQDAAELILNYIEGLYDVFWCRKVFQRAGSKTIQTPRISNSSAIGNPLPFGTRNLEWIDADFEWSIA